MSKCLQEAPNFAESSGVATKSVVVVEMLCTCFTSNSKIKKKKNKQMNESIDEFKIFFLENIYIRMHFCTYQLHQRPFRI